MPVESTDRELDIRLLLCGSVGGLLDAERFYIGHSVSLRQLLLLMKKTLFILGSMFLVPLGFLMQRGFTIR